MPHLSENDLQQRLADAAMQIKIGALYRHYKDKLYQVTNLAIIEENNEIGVIYQAQYGQKLTFIRPLKSWLETVELEGQVIPRFKLEQS